VHLRTGGSEDHGGTGTDDMSLRARKLVQTTYFVKSRKTCKDPPFRGFEMNRLAFTKSCKR
jgi:hypothetical protein